MIMMTRARGPIKVANERQTPKVSPEAKAGLNYKVTIESLIAVRLCRVCAEQEKAV